MKIKPIFVVLTVLSLLPCASISRAADITAAQSGYWGDTNVWIGGVAPGTNDSADIPAGIDVTVNTNATVGFIYDDGTVTMAAGSTLTVTDPTGASGTDGLGVLNATAAGNTVIYACNPFWAKACNYYNLVLANTNYVDPIPPWSPYQNFNNFSRHGPTPMTIAGDMTVIGYTRVQQGSGGAPITIGGNWTIGTNCIWDSSGDDLTVASNAFIYGLLSDFNGALGSNYFGGNVTVAGPGPSGWNPATGTGTNGWFVSDVITWGIGGSLTNNGAIWGTGYGSISFEGTGFITGTNALTLPTLTIDGTYTIGTTVTCITNTPTLNGTLVFDIANPKQIILLTNAGTALYYSGNLNVINSGVAPASGAHYQLFNCTNGYGGAFALTNLPSLPAGLSWVDNLLTTGSIDVTGTAGRPTLTITRNGGFLILSWNSTAYPGYSVQGQTNQTGGLSKNWYPTGSGTVSPFTNALDSANRSVFFRLSNP
jgi:hypothetical protein